MNHMKFQTHWTNHSNFVYFIWNVSKIYILPFKKKRVSILTTYKVFSFFFALNKIGGGGRPIPQKIGERF